VEQPYPAPARARFGKPALGGLAAAIFYIPLSIIAAPVEAAAAAARPVIPFTAAQVTSPDNKVFTISWRAPGVRRVRIFAGTDSEHVGDAHLVARGGGDGAAVVTDLGPAIRWYFRLVPDRGEPLVIADRSLHLTTAGNFRDAGGYRTLDGKWVRMGVAYRSNGLEHLSADETQTVADLRLKLILDLRTDEERQKGPDKVTDVPDVQANVLGDDAAWLHDLTTNPASALVRQKASQPHQIYRDFVDLDSARRAYGLVLRRLADSANAPVVFHCTAGKDRSGWADAVLLTILGVPRATVFEDYELTNVYLQGAALASVRSQFAPSSAPAQHRLMADPADLQAAFDEVNRRYGSFDHYLHAGLGLTDRDIRNIRGAFLIG